MTRTRFLLFSLVALAYLTGLVIWQWPDDNAHLIVCDVGQGDAILITQHFTQVLIDGGPDDQVLGCLGQYLPFWDKKLELMVATHGDKDHIGGLSAVFSQYQVKRLLQSDRGKESADFADFQQIISSQREKGLQVITSQADMMLSLEENSTFKVVWPLAETQLSAVSHGQSLREDNANDGSIVLLWQFEEVRTLLTGDLEAAGEQALLRRGVLLDIDILKVGHHGSKTSTTPAFLEETTPEIALISCGKNNRYGHPHNQTLLHLEQRGTRILRTDQEGSLELVINGLTYWRKGEKKAKNEVF